MEQIKPAGRSSGVYDAHYDHQSYNSADDLRGTLDMRQNSIVTLTGMSGNAAHPSGATGVAAPIATIPQADKIPFYKKRNFIISQLILIPLAIALLFIILFPVVRAIAALVIKRSNLDVQRVFITEPVNSS